MAIGFFRGLAYRVRIALLTRSLRLLHEDVSDAYRRVEEAKAASLATVRLATFRQVVLFQKRKRLLDKLKNANE